MDQTWDFASRSCQRSVSFTSQRPVGATSSREIDIPAEIFAAPSSAKTETLAEALRAGGIFYGLGGGDTAAALRSIVNTLPLPPNSNRDSLAQLLLAREALGSTAIGEGIAIPHVRRPNTFEHFRSLNFALLSREASSLRRFRRPTGLCDLSARKPNRPHASPHAFATVVCAT